MIEFRDRTKLQSLTLLIGPTYNRSLSDVLIDINRTLPGGATNPNFLKPYFEATQRYDNLRDTENVSARFAAAYIADTRFGKFTVNVLGGTNTQSSELRAWHLMLPFESDSRLWPGRHSIRFRQYWDQADRSMPEFTAPVRAVNPVTGVTQTVTPRMVVDTLRADNVSDTKTTYNYGNLAVQGKLLKERLHVIAAFRRDDYKNSSSKTRAAGDYPMEWNGFDAVMRPNAPADYFTFSRVVARDAAGNAIGGTIPADVRPRDSSGFRLPQYANDRFRDDYNPPDIKGSVDTYTIGGVYHVTRWLGLSANYAETFNPPPSNAQRYDGSLIPPTAAKGVDFGVRFNLLGGRVAANVNYFESHEDNAVVFTPAGSASNFNIIYLANAIGDRSANGRNIRGFADLPLVLRDTQRQNTSGFEVDITANLTPQWRLLANLSTSKPEADKAFPDSIAYYTEHENDFIQILNDAGVIVNPTTKVATVNTTVPAAIASPDAQGAANAWNSVQTTFLANLTSQPRQTTGSFRVTANMFTDYTFRRGWLNGVRVGAGVNYRSKHPAGVTV